MIRIGTLCLGKSDGNEVGEWDIDLDQGLIDNINESRPLEIDRVSVFAVQSRFYVGDRVRKKKGSEWQGRVVGYYSTDLNPDGICVESEVHKGSVQIYPAYALELVEEQK